MKSAVIGTRLSVLSVALCAAFSAHAQSTSSSTLPEVVVVASRFAESRLEVPQAVQVITREAMERSAAQSVPEVLRMLGGINVRSVVGGQLGLNASVDLAGYGVTATQNTLILVDGRRLNPIDSSEIDWSAVPLSSVQRIEITPGSAGVQFGAGASGGVIYISTDAAATPRSQVAARAGSFGTAELELNLVRQFGDMALSVQGGARHTDGWRENARADGQNLGLKLSKDLGAAGSVFAEVLLSHSANGFSGGVLGQVGSGDVRRAKFNNVGSENQVDQQGLRLGGMAALSEHTTLDVDVYAGTKRSNFVRPYYATADSLAGFFASPDALRMDGVELSIAPRLRTEWAGGSSLVYGLDFSRTNQDAVNTYGILAQQFILANQGPGLYLGNLVSDRQSVQLLNRAAYVLARVPLGTSLEFSAGARRQLQGFDSYDLNTAVGFAQTGSGTLAANAHEAGLNLKLNDSSRTYLRMSQSYRFANTDEYWGYDTSFNRVFSGELRPQTTKAYELGYDFKNSRQQFGAVLAHSLTQDEIRYDPAVFQNRNLLDNIARTSLSVNWSGQVLDKSHVMLGARWQRAEYANGAFSGQTPGMVPTAVYNAGWVQELAEGSQLGLQLTHVSRQNYDASPTVMSTLAQMPAYTTADLFWARRYGKLDTKVTVKNLGGASYAAYGGYGFVSMPAGGGLTTYYYYPSDPLSLHLSMAYQF